MATNYDQTLVLKKQPQAKALVFTIKIDKQRDRLKAHLRNKN